MWLIKFTFFVQERAAQAEKELEDVRAGLLQVRQSFEYVNRAPTDVCYYGKHRPFMSESSIFSIAH